MQLPSDLKLAIEELATRLPQATLIQATAELSANYRQRTATAQRFITHEAHRIAYLTTRLPATFAALVAVLREVKTRLAGEPIATILDLGAGPGTAMWAARQVFDELAQITLVERDANLIQLGQQCATKAPPARQTAWLNADLGTLTNLPTSDLIIASYSLGELSAEQVQRLLPRVWAATEKVLVLIEPGTMAGFQLLRQLRDELLRLGGQVVAPCPHQQACPMPATDWCHFAARVERTALHRKLKGGALGYEDEKFAYLAVAKSPLNPVAARILRRPQMMTGFVRLELCTGQGLQSQTVTRKNKYAFKQARHAGWGDAWNEIMSRVNETDSN